MEKYIEKAKVIVEALPYIKKFTGKTIVIKYGGSAMVDEQMKQMVIEDIVIMKLVGFNPVIVHGGGNEISSVLDRMQIQSEFYQGLRITDQQTMEVVEMVLSGKVNKDIVQLIQNHDMKAVGISGKDGKTLTVRKKIVAHKDIGYVGEVDSVNTELIHSLVQNDFIPVIAPIGTDVTGQTYNINADYAASAIAGALQAEKLIFLTDVEGVLANIKDSSSRISAIHPFDVDSYIQDQIISGGMIPKVMCCVEGIESGVHHVHILDGRVEHSMLLEMFTNKGIGTMFGMDMERRI